MLRKLFLLESLIAMFSFLISQSVFCQSGSLDLTFNPTDVGYGFNDNLIKLSALQADDKIVFYGRQSGYYNVISRLNTDGSIDGSFKSSEVSTINTINIQSDGKIIIAGDFLSCGGVKARKILRLNTDGTIDNTFNIGLGSNNSIYCSAIQPDGKIIFGGYTTKFNGTAVSRLFRLNSDGTLDNSFNSTDNNGILKMALQPDGKLVVVGTNNSDYNYVKRYNSDGSVDGSFPTMFAGGSKINAIAIQNDLKILVAGAFTSFNNTNKNRIVRLNSDGTFDNSFISGSGTDGTIDDLKLLSDGKIMVWGNISKYNNQNVKGLIKLNSDGTLNQVYQSDLLSSTKINILSDSNGKIILNGGYNTYEYIGIVRFNLDGTIDNTFNKNTGTSINNTVLSTAIQPNGKILIGGNFTSYFSTPVNRLTRLNTDGSKDNSFNIGSGANDLVCAIAITTNGKILVGGDFDYFNGVRCDGLIQLNSDGSIDNNFTLLSVDKGIRSIVLQSNGKILVGGSITATNDILRLNADGTIDNTFNPPIYSSGPIYSIALQTDDKIVGGGQLYRFDNINVYRIFRLNTNGTLDNVFRTGIGTGFDGDVIKVEIQPDGKILVAGVFQKFNGQNHAALVRLNSDGTIDNSFNCILGSKETISVNTIALQTDGKILVSGYLNSCNGVPVKNFFRINSDGSLDYTFNSGFGINEFVKSISLQPDAKIIIGGYFSSYNGIGRNRIARINGGNDADLCAILIDSTVTDSISFLVSNTYGATYQWLDCLSNKDSIQGETNRFFPANGVGNYAVKISKYNCQKTTPCFDFSVGHKDIKSTNSQIVIYPNPSNGILVVKSTSELPIYITIFDSNGEFKLNKFCTSEETSVDLSQYPSGLYLIKIEYDNEVEYKKVIVY